MLVRAKVNPKLKEKIVWYFAKGLFLVEQEKNTIICKLDKIGSRRTHTSAKIFMLCFISLR